MSYKAVCYDSSGPGENALRFARACEAQGYAENLYGRWTAMTKFVVKPTLDPVTHRWTGEQVQEI